MGAGWTRGCGLMGPVPRVGGHYRPSPCPQIPLRPGPGELTLPAAPARHGTPGLSGRARWWPSGAWPRAQGPAQEGRGRPGAGLGSRGCTPVDPRLLSEGGLQPSSGQLYPGVHLLPPASTTGHQLVQKARFIRKADRESPVHWALPRRPRQAALGQAAARSHTGVSGVGAAARSWAGSRGGCSSGRALVASAAGALSRWQALSSR